MTFRRSLHCSIWIFPACVSVGHADQIVTRDESFVGARVVGMQNGQLRFHNAVGTPHSVWLDDIGLILVDQRGIFIDFNEAERFRANNEPQKAIVRYRRAQRLAEGFWSEVISIRMFQSYDAVGQIDHAITHYLKILDGDSSGPVAAAQLLPTNIPDRPNAKVNRAVKTLNTALSRKPDAAARALMEIVRYDIIRRSGDKRIGSAGRRLIDLAIPPQSRSPRAYEIVMDAFDRETKSTITSEVLIGLNRTIRDCPRALLPDFLLKKGRALLRVADSREDYVRAAWPFLRIAIHFPAHRRAPDGLMGAALAVEHLGRADRARTLLEECLAHAALADETRTTALQALKRLQDGATKQD